MNFDLTDEQKLLQDSLARYLQRHSGLEAGHAAYAGDRWKPELWAGLAGELGVFAAALPEADGGFGGGAVETMLIAEELGRALVVSPYIETIVVAMSVLRGDEGTAGLRAAIVAGEAIVAPALHEPGKRFDTSRFSTLATGDRLTGGKVAVNAAPIASQLLIPAQDGDGVSLYLVEADAAGVTRRDYRLIDGTPASDIELADVKAVRVGTAGTGGPRLDRAVDEGIAALCAEAVGVLDVMLLQTVTYTRQREQFGVPISSFQVLQHRMADMATLLERSRSMSVMATLSLELPAPERQRAISAAKAFVSEALKSVGEAAIQLHGGIGTTEEIAVSHYFKRATVLQSQFGTAAYHLKRMGDATHA